MLQWPDGKKIAVAFTFDFDAETYWTGRDAQVLSAPGNTMRGEYGAKEGIYRVLDLLKESQIKGTFFVPGWVAEKYAQQVALIHAGGHEIGYHGYLHEQVRGIAKEEEAVRMAQCEEIMQSITGRKMVGYRAPGGVMHPFTVELLKERNYFYSSSMKDADSPYIHKINGMESDIVELCSDQSLDDNTYFFFCLTAPYVRRGINPPCVMLECWQRDFAVLKEEGGRIMIIKCHPQLIGRPLRIEALREFISFVLKEDAWVTTCEEIARYVLAEKQG